MSLFSKGEMMLWYVINSVLTFFLLISIAFPAMAFRCGGGVVSEGTTSHEVMNNIVNEFREKKSGNKEADWKKMLQIVEDKIGINVEANGTLLNEKEMAQLKAAFLASIYGEGVSQDTYGNYDPLTATSIRLLTDKAGVSWCTPAHTGISVPVYAIGQGTEQLSGYVDNTDIPKVMENLMGIGN